MDTPRSSSITANQQQSTTTTSNTSNLVRNYFEIFPDDKLLPNVSLQYLRAARSAYNVCARLTQKLQVSGLVLFTAMSYFHKFFFQFVPSSTNSNSSSAANVANRIAATVSSSNNNNNNNNSSSHYTSASINSSGTNNNQNNNSGSASATGKSNNATFPTAPVSNSNNTTATTTTLGGMMLSSSTPVTASPVAGVPVASTSTSSSIQNNQNQNVNRSSNSSTTTEMIHPFEKYHPVLVAVAAYFLALKTECIHKQLDDLICFAFEYSSPRSSSHRQEISIRREQIGRLEVMLMETLDFNLFQVFPWVRANQLLPPRRTSNNNKNQSTSNLSGQAKIAEEMHSLFERISCYMVQFPLVTKLSGAALAECCVWFVADSLNVVSETLMKRLHHVNDTATLQGFANHIIDHIAFFRHPEGKEVPKLAARVAALKSRARAMYGSTMFMATGLLGGGSGSSTNSGQHGGGSSMMMNSATAAAAGGGNISTPTMSSSAAAYANTNQSANNTNTNNNNNTFSTAAAATTTTTTTTTNTNNTNITSSPSKNSTSGGGVGSRIRQREDD